MKKLPFYYILVAFLLVGCNKGEIYEITDQCSFPEQFITPCFYKLGDIYKDRIVITNQDDYMTFQYKIKGNIEGYQCDTVHLPEVNFNNYSILGVVTTGGGCGAIYERKVYKDTGEKKIIYKIKVDYKGNCFIYLQSWNWVFIPKLPKGYSVDFQVN
jgi:hypothetical protein